MNTHGNAANSLLLIGIDHGDCPTDSAMQAVIAHCRRLTLRCIEIFGGHTPSPQSAPIIAAFSSANTACRAALVIREKTAALLAAESGRAAPGIPIICLQEREYVSMQTGSLVMEKLSPIIDALMTGEVAGRMHIDTDTLKALSPDLQRHFQPEVDAPAHRLPAGHRFYRYLAARDADATEMAAPAAYGHASLVPAAQPPRAQTPVPTIHDTQPTGPARLYLTHADTRIVLDGNQQTFTIGRNRSCHLCITGANISRLHAWIHEESGRFILLDQSTNGTFVKIGNAAEIYLHRQEIVLREAGLIGLAGSTKDPAIPQIAFQVSRAGS